MRHTITVALLFFATVSTLKPRVAHADELKSRLVPYCSVGMATVTGQNRTMWDIGEIEDSCEAAKVWLGQDPDWQASGEFLVDQENEVEIRCYYQQIVFNKKFKGIGAAPFEEANNDPVHEKASCLVLLVGDGVRELRPPVSTRGIHQFSTADEIVVRELAQRLAADPSNAQRYQLPELNFDKETGEVSLFVPEDPRDLLSDAEIEARLALKSTGIEPDDTVHEVEVTAEGGDERGFGERNLVDLPSAADIPSVASIASDDAKKVTPHVTEVEEKILFGRKSKIAGTLKYDLDFKQNGDGRAEAEARAYVLNNRIGLLTAVAQTKRNGTQTADPADDRIDFKANVKVKVLGKTQGFPMRNASVKVDYREKVGPEEFVNSSLYSYTFTFPVGPVIIDVELSIRGIVGIKEDYVGVKLADDDATNIVMHAGVRPYIEVIGMAKAQPITGRLPEGIKIADANITAEVTFVNATFLADADFATKSSGPCAQVKMLEPKGGGVVVKGKVKLDLFSAAPEAVADMVEDMCDIVEDTRQLGDGGISVGGITGGLQETVGRLCDGCDIDGVSLDPSVVSYGTALEAFEHGAGIAKGNLVKVIGEGNVEMLQNRFLEACDDMHDVIVKAGKLSKFVHKKEFYRYPEQDLGSERRFWHNDSCKHVPPPTTLEVCNKHPGSPIDVAVARNEGGANGWVVGGWYSVAPASCRKLPNFGSFTGDVYVHAFSRSAGKVWGKGDASFCVDEGRGFSHAHADSMSCSGAGLSVKKFSRTKLESGSNRYTFNTTLPTVKFCNDTDFDKVFAAVGYVEEGQAKASGWITIGKGACADVLRLADGPIYGFATADTSSLTPSWSPGPNRSFCVAQGVFKDLKSDSGCPGGSQARNFHRLTGNTWHITGAP